MLVASLYGTSRHDTSTQCWANVGPASSTLSQHQPSIGWTCRVCWGGVPFPACDKCGRVCKWGCQVISRRATLRDHTNDHVAKPAISSQWIIRHDKYQGDSLITPSDSNYKGTFSGGILTQVMFWSWSHIIVSSCSVTATAVKTSDWTRDFVTSNKRLTTNLVTCHFVI